MEAKDKQMPVAANESVCLCDESKSFPFGTLLVQKIFLITFTFTEML